MSIDGDRSQNTGVLFEKGYNEACRVGLGIET